MLCESKLLLVVVLLAEMLLEESPLQEAPLTGLVWGEPAGESEKGGCMGPPMPFAKFGALFFLGFRRGWATRFGPGEMLGLLDVDLDGDKTICL